jgi:hypothetical protein
MRRPSVEQIHLTSSGGCDEAVRFVGLSDHLKRLSANGDPLEELGRTIHFEGFRPLLEAALAYPDGKTGGRPPYDAVAMFKVLILADYRRARIAKGQSQLIGVSLLE